MTGSACSPLAAVRCGIESGMGKRDRKAPISITKRHSPDMEHLWDTKVDGGRSRPSIYGLKSKLCRRNSYSEVAASSPRSSSIRAQIKSTQTVSRSSPRYQPRFHRVRAWPCGQHRPFESQPASSRCPHGRRSS